MTDRFPIFVERVLAHEGGFIDHPQDPGGATNFGITERVARANGYRGHMRNLPRETAIAIYRKGYWDAVRGDELPAAVAFQVFDAAVNHGVGNASRWIQRAAGVADDGMSPAAVVIIINRPRPRPNATQPDTQEMSVLADDNDSFAEILRRAADQLDAGPGTGEA